MSAGARGHRRSRAPVPGPRPSPGCGTGRLGARPRGSREGLAHSRCLANVLCTSLPPGQLRPVLPEGPRHPRGCRRVGLSTPLVLSTPPPPGASPCPAWVCLGQPPPPGLRPLPQREGLRACLPPPRGEGTPGFLLQWLSQACPKDTLLLPGPSLFPCPVPAARCPRPAGPAPTPASPAGLGLPPAPHVPPGLSWTSLSPQSGVFPPAPSPPFGRPPGDRGPHDSPRWGRTRVGRHGSPVSHP